MHRTRRAVFREHDLLPAPHEPGPACFALTDSLISQILARFDVEPVMGSGYFGKECCIALIDYHALSGLDACSRTLLTQGKWALGVFLSK